jgi:hypothetical protein
LGGIYVVTDIERLCENREYLYEQGAS